MSTWNNRFKHFSQEKQLQLRKLFALKGEFFLDDFNKEMVKKLNGRIECIYGDCIKGAIIVCGASKGGSYVSEEQFLEDCDEIESALDKLIADAGIK